MAKVFSMLELTLVLKDMAEQLHFERVFFLK